MRTKPIPATYDADELRRFKRTSKWLLWHVARQLAASCLGECDDLEGGRVRLYEEIEAQRWLARGQDLLQAPGFRFKEPC